jgi:hypothetical protein
MPQETAQDLRREIKRLEREMGQTQDRLARVESQCQHQWGAPVSNPIHTPGRTIPRQEGFGSHPPVPEFHISGGSTPRWTRTCRVCGKVEHTTSSTERTHTTHTPRW